MSERPIGDQEQSDAGYPPQAYDDQRTLRENARVGGADDEISLIDLLIVLAKHKMLLLGLPLLAGVLAVVYALMQPNIFTATAKLLPPQHAQTSNTAALLSQLGNVAGMSGLGTAKNTNDVYVAMMKSRTVADNLIQRFDLMNLYQVKYPTHARARLAGATTITVGKDGLITVEYDDQDPKRAAEFANAYVDELMKLTQVLAVTEASQRRLFFERQLAQAKNALAQSEIAARQALAQRGLVKVDDQGRAMVETTARLRGQMTVKEVQIGAMRMFATSENPELRMAQLELDSMKQELAKIEGGETGSPGRGTRMNSQGMDSLRLLRDVKYHEVVFELLARQFEIAKIDEAKESSVIQVLDSAVAPDFKSKPKRLQMVLVAVFAAGIFGVLAAFVSEAFAKARRNPQQAERLQAFKRYLAWR